MPYTHDGSVPYVTVETSHEAATEQARSGRAAADRIRIEALLRARFPDGATTDEVEAELGLLHQTASARMRDLVIEGVAHRTDVRRRTRSGRSAFVIALAPKGDQA